MNTKLKSKNLFIILLTIVLVFIVLKNSFKRGTESQPNSNRELIENLSFNFNESGFPFNVVPNIVHYILFDVKNISFGHFLSLLSVMKNHKPDLIYIHCNCHQLSGDYYERALKVADKTNIQLIVRTIEKPMEIFGQNLSKEYLNWHSSDISRIRALMEFGGIYLDNDIYVVQSFDMFRKYEMTLTWDPKGSKVLENQLLIANQNARFLKLWLDSYHDYKPEEWYYNAGRLPTELYLEKQPDLVHRVLGQFGSYVFRDCPILYESYYKNWSKEYLAFHLWMRGNALSISKGLCLGKDDAKIITVFTEENVRQLNVTFGEMSRNVFDFEKRIIS